MEAKQEEKDYDFYQMTLTFDVKKEMDLENEQQQIEDINVLNQSYGEVCFGVLSYEQAKSYAKKSEGTVLDWFCRTFDVLDNEAKPVLNFMKQNPTKQFLYVQKIDLGFSRGMGVGAVALKKLFQRYPTHEVVLFSYPIPARTALAFDKTYMKEAKKKLDTFYRGIGMVEQKSDVFTYTPTMTEQEKQC